MGDSNNGAGGDGTSSGMTPGGNPWAQSGGDPNVPAAPGGGGDTGAHVTTPPADDDVTAQPPVAQPAQPVVQQPPATVQLTPEQLRELVAGVAPAPQPQAPPPEPQLTQEQFNQMMRVFTADEAVATKLGLTPEAAPVLNEILQAVVRQAVTMAGYQARAQQQQLNAQLAPLQQYYLQQQENAYRQEFMGLHPEFKGYEPLLESVYAQLKVEGARFKTPQEAYKTISERAKAVIAKLPGAQLAQKPVGQKPNMSTLSGGGQVTGGAGGGGKPKISQAQAIFGPRK